MTAARPEMRQESPEAVGQVERRSRMEQLIETVASGMGNTVAFLAESGALFAVFVVAWVAFGAALIWSQGSLDTAWQWVRGLPLIVQGIVWLLFLPVMFALWVWETTWPIILRLVLIVGVAGWNLIVFLPRALQAGRP